MKQDTLTKISSYFRGLNEELIDNDALLRILDVITPVWNDVSTPRLRAVVTLAVAAGVFRYHEHDHLQPFDQLTISQGSEDEYPMSDARYWSDDYEDFLLRRGVADSSRTS